MMTPTSPRTRSCAICMGWGGCGFPRPRRSITRWCSRRDAWGWYGLSLVLFVFALLSKSVTCSLPAAIILMLLWQRKRISWFRLATLAPMFAMGLALALNTAHIEREHVGAEGPEFAFSL